MKLRTIAFASAGAAALAAPAFAGSPAPAPAPAQEPVYVAPTPTSGEWTGGYVGAELGYGSGDAAGLSDDAMLYGLTAGYDYDLGNWVLGAGLDYDWTELSLGGVDVDNLARLKLRAGYDLGQGLLYGTGGAAKAFTTAGDDTGWFAGVGYEHKVTDSISVGGEALYHAFDNFNGSGVDADGTTLQLRTSFRF